MNWTRPADIRDFVQRCWSRGLLLTEPERFPLRVPLKGPSSEQLAGRFAEVQAWIAELGREEGRYRLEFRNVRHRLLGANRVPGRIWIDSAEQALALIGKESEGEQFAALQAETGARCPALLDWLRRRPLRALELLEEWSSLLDVVTWVQRHPHSGVYLRQVDFPGVHTKFIEQHQGVLREMLLLALPQEEHSAETGPFERRFGFREKSARVRFRFLDHSTQVPEGWTDLSLVHEEFAAFIPQLRRVFITENEINYLVFPPLPDSLVIFGAGYGIENLRQAHWLGERELYYWGDIDTHGFAILDQLRRSFPHTRSLLMDRATLLEHRSHWVRESRPTERELPRLSAEEAMLYTDLCRHRLGSNVRLEQEMIRYPWVLGYLERLA